MAAVTGITAARAQEIEDASIVDGAVTGDDLILFRHDGTSLNAGNVRGPQGDPGADAATGDVNPTAGTTPIRGTGGVVKGGTPVSTNDLTTKAYVDAADATLTSAVSGLTAQVTGTEIGNAVNLNSYMTPGLWFQSSDAEAAAGTNYPEPKAGVLEVVSNIGSTFVIQKYIPAAQSSNYYYLRTYNAAAWTSWKVYETASAADTGWINLTHVSGWSIANTDDQFQYRVRNKIVYIRGVGVGTYSSGTYHTIVAAGGIPAQYRVERTVRGGTAGQSAKSGSFQLLTDGSISMGTFQTTVPAWLAMSTSYPVP